MAWCSWRRHTGRHYLLELDADQPDMRVDPRPPEPSNRFTMARGGTLDPKTFSQEFTCFRRLARGLLRGSVHFALGEKMKKVMSALSLFGVLCAAPAAAVVIDFNSAPGGCYNSYTDQGVTFTASDGLGLTSFSFGPTPNGTPGVISCLTTGSFASTVATFASTNSGSVSVDLGDFNVDSDAIFLELYDAANNLLAQSTAILAADFVGMVTLSASAANVAYAVFGGFGELGSSVYGDNFTFNPVAVPEPAPLALIALGLVLLAGRRRR